VHKRVAIAFRWWVEQQVYHMSSTLHLMDSMNVPVMDHPVRPGLKPTNTQAAKEPHEKCRDVIKWLILQSNETSAEIVCRLSEVAITNFVSLFINF
jgi:hypothetical protein